MLSLAPAIARQRTFLIDKYPFLRELANIQKRLVVISLKKWGRGSDGGWSDSGSRVRVAGDGRDGSGDGAGNLGGSGDADETYSGDCITNGGGSGGDGDGSGVGGDGDGDDGGDSVDDGCASGGGGKMVIRMVMLLDFVK
ncbi:hypothetical protein PoB_001006300 [Plakobranchus ocellatus]|uniref:Uncharacterized protein n=1 Tax=Plakobranchus ocellatus TaxID=259542 RepID=A0AAV3YMQ4_9GAST|nr:hypothetical protein PoB_001006300 [Plakobranchus ocellatus]